MRLLQASGWQRRVAFHGGRPRRTTASEGGAASGLGEQGGTASYGKQETQPRHTAMNKTEIRASERWGADEVECDALKMAVSD